MKHTAIVCLRLALNLFYAVCKLFPTRRKVVMMSREFDKEPLDFMLLREELKRRDPLIKVVALCKTVPKGTAIIGYAFYMLQCIAHLATASVCVVDTYCLPVSLLNHKKTLTVMQIWHALGAIKQFGYQSVGLAEGRDRNIAKWLRMHRGYTHVLCPSKATAAIYKQTFGVSDEQLYIGGMPRIDWLLSDQTALKQRILQENPRLNGKTVVLYVPTFRTGKPTAYRDIVDRIDSNRYEVVVNAHPLDTDPIESKYRVNGYSSSELLSVADIVITDYSAIAFEAALQQKRLYFYVYDLDEYRDEKRGLNIVPTEELPSCSAIDADTLMDLLEQPYDADALAAFCARYIETADTHNTARLADYVERRLVR